MSQKNNQLNEILREEFRKCVQSHNKIISHQIPLDKTVLLDDEAVMKLLRLSKKTLRRLQHQKIIKGIKIGSRYYYFRHLVYMEFLNYYYSK